MEESPSPRSGSARPDESLPLRQAAAHASADRSSDLPFRREIGFSLPQATHMSERRPSVHFVPQVKVDGSDKGGHSRNTSGELTGRGRRLSSPPPPDQFQQRVSFDTFENRDATDFSLTLNRKHRDYHYSKRSRTFMCGTDANHYSDTALEWLIDELVDDGDEVVCLRVVERDSKEARDLGMNNNGGEARDRAYRAEAARMLEHIQSKNSDDRAINLVLEFAIGKVQETMQSMIRVYEPAMLVVGTKGRSLQGFQGLMPGSVSKYCLQYSPIPVIVVRPSSKRDKKKSKRLRDPARQGYRDILDRSGDAEEGGHILDERNRRSILSVQALSELGKSDAEQEARMVAEAIGYRPEEIKPDDTPLQRVVSAQSETSGRSVRSGSVTSLGSTKNNVTDSSAATASAGAKSPALGKLMKSPDINPDMDSDGNSDDSEDEDYDLESSVTLDVKEEALARARDRALQVAKEESDERNNALSPPSSGAKGRSRSNTTDSNSGAASGPLAMLDALKASAVEKRAAERRKRRSR